MIKYGVLVRMGAADQRLHRRFAFGLLDRSDNPPRVSLAQARTEHGWASNFNQKWKSTLAFSVGPPHGEVIFNSKGKLSRIRFWYTGRSGRPVVSIKRSIGARHLPFAVWTMTNYWRPDLLVKPDNDEQTGDFSEASPSSD